MNWRIKTAARPLKTSLGILLYAFLLAGPAAAQDTLDLYPGKPGALKCWSEIRSTPRPLRIHYLKLDLTCPDIGLYAIPSEDPDGDGPGEGKLTDPLELFNRSGVLAAINANAFAGMPGTENDIRGWYKNRPVNIEGMVVSDGKVISPDQEKRTAFRVDRQQHPKLGSPGQTDEVWQAVSDWQMPLITEAGIVPDSTYKVVNPRTALGWDDSGKWLLMVVVDGRQNGYSEGIGLRELAILFQNAGCTRALNLDGGGSSIMLIKDSAGKTLTVNSPSGGTPRPIPVMLGVRKIR